MLYVSINTKHIITIFTIIVIVIEYARQRHDQQEKHFHFYLINDIIKGTIIPALTGIDSHLTSLGYPKKRAYCPDKSRRVNIM